jgi:DNA-binding PadR family transcriptional regulator
MERIYNMSGARLSLQSPHVHPMLHYLVREGLVSGRPDEARSRGPGRQPLLYRLTPQGVAYTKTQLQIAAGVLGLPLPEGA